MNTSTPGTTLTQGIMDAGTVYGASCDAGANCIWGPPATGAFTVGANPGGLANLGPVAVNGGTTYAANTLNYNSVAYNTDIPGPGTTVTLDISGAPGTATSLSGLVGLMTPPIQPEMASNIDMLIFYSSNGDYAAMQFNPHCTGSTYGVWIEVKPTAHSSCISVLPQTSYYFAMYYNFTSGLATLYVYNPNGTLFGSTSITSGDTGGTFALVRFGNDESGFAPGTSYFQNLMLNWTTAPNPMFWTPGSVLNPNPNPNPESFVAVSDFNGDGKSDILWRDTSTEQIYEWLMNGTAVTNTGNAAPTSDWVIQGVADFNGDGKADILWQNSTTGEVYVWLMNGTSIASQGTPGTVSPSSGWVIAGVGDFNGNGTSDILWRNTTSGEVYLWLMNGTTIASQGEVGAVSPSSGWNIVGVGDFNGDGKADILWQNSTSGEVYIWLMSGTTIASQGTPATVSPSSGWSIAGAGDFDGNGTSDILWRNTTSGEVYIWLMNGTTITSQGSPGTVSSVWSIQGVGDYNGDGKADVLWRNTSGEVYVWEMNGLTIASQGSPGTASSPWQISPLVSP